MKVNGKNRLYWNLSRKNPVLLNVVGPASLKMMTRAILSGDKEEVLFGVIPYIDGKRQRTIGRATSDAKSVLNPQKPEERIGNGRTLVFQVPEGAHEYKFLPSRENAGKVYARFLLAEQIDPDTKYIAYLPRSFPAEIPITIKEREYLYYRCWDDSPVELEVIGPTQIKGIARFEFDHTMRGDKPFRIQVSENGKIIMTRPFTAEISATAAYNEPSDKLIGKGETFFINVPPGRHRYQITTPEKGTTVLLRFYLPQKALGFEQETHSAKTGLLSSFNKVWGG